MNLDGSNEPDLTAEVDSGAVDTSTSATPAGETSSVLGSFLRQREFEVPDGVDDDTILGHMQTWADRAAAIPEGVDPAELPSLIEQARTYAQHREQFEAWQRSQQNQPAPQPAPAQAAPQTTPAQAASVGVDANTLELYKTVCEWDANAGIFKPKAPGFESQAAKLNELAIQRRQNLERFGQDPDSFIDTRFKTHAERLREEIRQEVLKEINPDLQAWRDYRQQQEQEHFIAPFRSQLVASGANGEVLSPKGQQFEQAFQSAPEGLSHIQRLQWAKNHADAWEAQQAALPAPTSQTQFTLRKAQAAAPTQPAAQPQQPPNTQAASPPAVSKKQAFIDAGRHVSRDPESGQFVSPRDGTVRRAMDSGGEQVENEPFEKLYERLSRNGAATH